MRPGPLRDRKCIVQFDLSLLQLLEQDLEGHELAHGRRMDRLVGVLLDQHGPGLVVDDDRLLGERIDSPRRAGRKHRHERRNGGKYIAFQ